MNLRFFGFCLGGSVFKNYEDLFRQMEQEMERMAESAMGRFQRVAPGTRIWQPRADVCETEDAVQVTVELAGLSPEAISRQVEITLSPDNRTLVLYGRRQEPECKGERLRCHQLEIYYGEFGRVIPLPHGVPIERENLSATYSDGLLVIELPKRLAEEPRSIAIDHQ